MMSSMLSGEKRWASQRRGGLTVLEKKVVVVPEAINLPSQRANNQHSRRGAADSKQNRQGRKGYGSWRNQHASTEPTWQGMLDGQSSNSNKMAYKSTGHQKIDTNIVKAVWVMKGHRGGAGNNHEFDFDHRKTTSGGEVEQHHTSQPPVAITIPTDLPATSKESRARAIGDRSSSHWQPKSTGTAEKLGIAFFKNGGFSLTSGDEGSEEDTTTGGKNAEPQDHSRPGSSSSSEIAAAGVEKWHADPFPNAGIPPPPPVNNHPGGPWYNGGLPYQSPVPLPMEPIHYYGPQVPGPPPFPPPGAGPRGHPFRPPMADAYVRPMWPWFYPPPPPVAYEEEEEESKHGEVSSLIQKIQDLSVKQRQQEEEEEERTREQKAKALAKLEELNRRTQGVESSAQKMGADSASAVVLSKQEEEPPTVDVVYMPPGKSEASSGSAGVQKLTVLSDDEPPSELTKRATGEKYSQFLSGIRQTAIRICKHLFATIAHVTAHNLSAIAMKIIRTSVANILELFYKLFRVLGMESTPVAQCVARGLDVLKIFSDGSPKLAAVSDALTSLEKLLASSFLDPFGQPMLMGKSW